MNNQETASRICYSTDVMAKANGITLRQELDILVGIATRALAEGKTEIQALEEARHCAKRMKTANQAVDKMLMDIQTLEGLIFERQALSCGAGASRRSAG